MKIVLQNEQNDYVEVFFYPDDTDPESIRDYIWGYVHAEKFVAETDFVHDKIRYVNRWVPYKHLGSTLGSPFGFTKIGRETGYLTKWDAINGFCNEIQKWRDW